jgi:hypothetical protein
MAPLVNRSHKVTGNYRKAATSRSVLRRIRKLGAPRGTKTPEGFLFPATYTLTAGSSAKQLVAKQLQAFKQNFAHVNMRYAHAKHLTRYDVLIIASMIEREAELPRERPLVSAVIYNRLRQGMPLGIDATIRYYTNNWQRPIRVSELEADEPYNTRLNRGLPPTPIGNPGLSSLRAAAHPAHKPYLFYVRKPGKSGAHAFSSTDAQFERDVARYQHSRGQCPRFASGCAGGPWPTRARRACTMPRSPRSACTTGATSCCRSRPSAWPRRSARSRRRGSGASTTRSPTRRPRSRSRTRPPRRPAPWAPRTR